MNNAYGIDSKKATTLDELPPRMRAYVEIVGAELKVYPIADNDTDEKTILDALRFIIEDGVGR